MSDTAPPDRLWRSIWLGTVLLGFAYWLGALGRSGIAFHDLADLPKALTIPWKGACTFGLALAVALAGSGRPTLLLALALAISAVADMILAAGFVVLSGVLFSVSHVIAIVVFWQNRAHSLGPLRRLCAVLVPVLTFSLSVLAIHGTEVPLFFALYPLLSGVMAALAIRSRFSLWLCGLGAAIFVCSDVLVLAWLGVFQRDPTFGFLTWATYFGGYAMLAHGAALFAAEESPNA